MARRSTLFLTLSMGLMVAFAPVTNPPARTCRILVVLSYAEELTTLRNDKGWRSINVSALKALGIKPRPIMIRGAELIRNAP